MWLFYEDEFLLGHITWCYAPCDFCDKVKLWNTLVNISHVVEGP